MQEFYDYVQRGIRILLPALSGYIGKEMSRTYQNGWWSEVLYSLSDQHDLPFTGSYGDLLDSLDLANCLRLLDRKWGELFRFSLSMNCRTWAKELMGVRNRISHLGTQDLEQPAAERALDTMVLLCSEMDEDSAEELRALYREVRAAAGDAVPAVPAAYVGLAQPESESRRGAPESGSLLQMVDSGAVQKTTLTRKVTYGGKTVVYPVYRVRLDLLYYNDRNDRIATWISRYENENGEQALRGMTREKYNSIIEDFIVESNPDSIRQTQKNLQLVGQREPGVTLADGRIVDGNRRFTCLRRNRREQAGTEWFETVIMDMDIQADRKQIKLLELAIQHGEEKKVDYDLIDYAIGTYRDIVETQLLTAEEYAASANEAVAEVKKRLEIAEVIHEFLVFLRLPEQYYAARDYQVYSLFQEMMAPLKHLDPEEKRQLKTIAFHNTMMHAIADQRKFIRDIKGLVKSGNYIDYFAEQQKIGRTIQGRYREVEVGSKSDVDRFALGNADLTEELQLSLERALLRSRSQQLKAKPSENVEKCSSLLMEIDPRLFAKLDPDEKETLKAELAALIQTAERFRQLL